MKSEKNNEEWLDILSNLLLQPKAFSQFFLRCNNNYIKYLKFE